MKITSPAFADNETIPKEYTCDGHNINPPLVFEDVPVATKTLALIVWDPDVPRSIRADGNWDHWVIFNMPQTTTGLGAGTRPPGQEGKNTRGVNAYGGPCPPDREHRYFFKLYALDTALVLTDSVDRKEVESALDGHILASAELVGRYAR